MLVFVTGFCLGVAIGWLAYIHRDSVVAGLLLYAAPVLYVLTRAVMLPIAAAAGSMDMSLHQFIGLILDHYIGDLISLTLSWMVVGIACAQIVSWFIYKGFEPVEAEPENREDRRRRVRADMRYSDDYFD